jgi:hypothetical protein
VHVLLDACYKLFGKESSGHANTLFFLVCAFFPSAVIGITSAGHGPDDNWAYIQVGDGIGDGDTGVKVSSFNNRDSWQLVPYWTRPNMKTKNGRQKFSAGQPQNQPFAVRVQKANAWFGEVFHDVYHYDFIYVGVTKEGSEDPQFWVVHFAGEFNPNKGRIRKTRLD